MNQSLHARLIFRRLLMSNFFKLLIPPIIPAFLLKLRQHQLNQVETTTSKEKHFKPSENLQWCMIDAGPLEGRFMYLDPEGPAYQKTVLDGTYDKFIYDYLDETRWNGSIIYDIGGHVGYHTLCFSTLVNPEGRVFCFEPHPFHLERIKINLSRNSDLEEYVKIMPIASSNSKGKIELFVLDNIEEGGSSASFIANASTHYPLEHYKWFHPVEVEQDTIDNLVSKDAISPPELIKIDVEGAESLVIEGALETINLHHPLIIVEVHNAPNMFNLTRLLSPLGYSQRLLEEENTRCFIAFEPPNQ